MKSRFLFYSLLGIAVCIRLFYVCFLPYGQTTRFRLEGLNDEPSHLNYVHYLADHKKFPVQTHHAREKDSFTRNGFEYYQAPVYYIAGAALEILVGKENSLFASRLLSFVFGILSLFIIKRIFNLLPLAPMIKDAAILFAAFFPSLAYFTSVVSNDSLCWFVALLLVYEMVAIAKQGSVIDNRTVWRSSIRIGLLLCLGILIKTSIIIFYPVFAIFPFYQMLFRKDKRWVVPFIVTLTLSLILAAPWYIRNLHVYGSLFAFSVGNGPPQFFLFSPHVFIRFVKFAIYYFWYPMQNVPPSHFISIIICAEAVIMIMLFLLLVHYIRHKKNVDRFEFFFFLIVLLNLIAFLKYNLYWDNNDGRFFFTSLAALLFMLCVPLFHFLKEKGKMPLFIPAIVLLSLFPYINLLFAK